VWIRAGFGTNGLVHIRHVAGFDFTAWVVFEIENESRNRRYNLKNKFMSHLAPNNCILLKFLCIQLF